MAQDVEVAHPPYGTGTTLDFFFDPASLRCWTASRWVVDVAPRRDVPVRWRAYSEDIQHGRAPTVAQRALRVVEAVWADHGDAPVGRLYTELGTRFVVQGDLTLDVVAAALEAAGLGARYVSAADDERWDTEVRWSMNEAIGVVGKDVSVPILVFTEGDRRTGVSGPVVSTAPTGEEAVTLWDHVVALAWSRGQDTEPPR